MANKVNSILLNIFIERDIKKDHLNIQKDMDFRLTSTYHRLGFKKLYLPIY